ncbi:MAG: CCA tRNA nucleotidyltransferase [Candidatus Omnitrophica bacterium]|nr:CCA tRNA nucleotidyltransferase [Candidatus Omnitrophota bacterium]
MREIGRLAEGLRRPAYAVGGCVRDWMTGVWRTEDLDVTVEGGGIEVAEAVGRALRGTVRVHRQFGTATLQLPGRVRGRIDFATCRRETYARPGAYPRVAPGTLHDDLFRRDFTINAMAAAIAPASFGTLIDPFRGAADLERLTLRVLHDRSFLDDPSRILRGIRFRHRFALRWEAGTARLLREALKAGALGWLNGGRLQKELERMGEEPDPIACFHELATFLDGASQS